MSPYTLARAVKPSKGISYWPRRCRLPKIGQGLGPGGLGIWCDLARLRDRNASRMMAEATRQRVTRKTMFSRSRAKALWVTIDAIHPSLFERGTTLPPTLWYEYSTLVLPHPPSPVTQSQVHQWRAACPHFLDFPAASLTLTIVTTPHP